MTHQQNGHDAHAPQATKLMWVGVWVWGFVLAALLLFIGYVLTRTSFCVDPAHSTKEALALGGCPAWIQRWYLVLHDWQTGIGAAVGLLGVAWSTFYKTAKAVENH